MRQNTTDDELLRSYLLGKLQEPEADRLEQRLLAEDDLFDLLESLEAELLAAASRGELAPAERERVFRRLASSPQGGERLALAQSLNRLADERLAPVVPLHRPAAASKPVFQWTALAAAALLATAGLFWFTRQTPIQPPTGGNGGEIANQMIHERPAPASPVPAPPAPVEKKEPTPQASPSPDRLALKDDGAPAAPAKRSEPVKALLELALTTLRDAGEEPEQLRLPSNAEVVEIQIDLEGLEDAGPFHASVRARGEEPIWDKKGLKPRKLAWGMALVLEDVPAKRLAPGLYEVSVTSSAEPEEMTQEFRVVRESR
jgi:hypothetical protein